MSVFPYNHLLRKDVPMKETTVISLTTSKGGVGKTTSTLNLAAALAGTGMRVAAIDNDFQGNLTAALGYTPGEQKYTLAKLLLTAIDDPDEIEDRLQSCILPTDCGYDLIAANCTLSDAALRLQVMQLSQ